MDRIRQTSSADNTPVMFLSDNGDCHILPILMILPGFYNDSTTKSSKTRIVLLDAPLLFDLQTT